MCYLSIALRKLGGATAICKADELKEKAAKLRRDILGSEPTTITDENSFDDIASVFSQYN